MHPRGTRGLGTSQQVYTVHCEVYKLRTIACNIFVLGPKDRGPMSSSVALSFNATCVNVLSQKYGCIIVGLKVCIVLHTVDTIHTSQSENIVVCYK